MSTASLTINASQTGVAYTSDLNDALAAINSCHSGTTAPTDDLIAGKLWLDTSGSNPVLKLYRNGWKPLFTLPASGNPSLDISSLTSSGTISSTGAIQAGKNSGGVALTNNDGYGNANVTFNHLSGTPEQDGNAARITVNTDSTSNGALSIQVGSNRQEGVSGGLTAAATFTDTSQTLNYAGSGRLNTSSSGVSVTGSLTATTTISAVDFNSTSDKRLKSEIKSIEGSVDTVLKLVGKSYKINEKSSFGVIAQEIEEVIPEAVSEDSKGYKSVNYNMIIPFLIESIKEQQEEISLLKRRLEELEK
jgi:hypothetical protein